MADDQFTAQLEWLCRIRRESLEISRLLRRVRKFVIEHGSKQGSDSGLRVWESQELAQDYDNLERVVSLFGDSTFGRYLEGPVVAQKPILDASKTLDLKATTSGVSEVDDGDLRPIKGPGRRHSAASRAQIARIVKQYGA